MDARTELFHKLPRISQPFITWLSGIPYQGERQIFRMSPLGVLLIGILFVVAGFLVIHWSLQQSWPLSVLPYTLGFALVASGTRRLDVLIVHQSLHGKVLKSRKGNQILAEILTTLLIRSPYKPNKSDHMQHHRSPCDENDVDVIYLRSTSIACAKNRKTLFIQVFKTVFSPLFHFRFALNRLLSNFILAKPVYRLFMSWAYIALICSPALLVGASYFYTLLLYWLIPLFLGFQISNFLYTATEHRWWLFNNKLVAGSEKRDRLTFARVCCNKAPAKSNSWTWIFWWLHALSVNLPTRLFVVVGDTLQHDLHHIVPNCDWPNSTFERPVYKKRFPERFENVWGGISAHLCEGNLRKGVE